MRSGAFLALAATTLLSAHAVLANGPQSSPTPARLETATTLAPASTVSTTAPATTSSTQHERQISEDADDYREAQQRRTREPVTVNQFCGSCGERAGNKQTECCDAGPKVTDWLMAWLTLALVILGAILGFRQLKLMNDTLATTRDAAGAALTQAKSASAALAHQISQERPWLSMKGDRKPTVLTGPSVARGAYVRVPWSMVNVGKDAAWLYQRTVRVVVISDYGPPEQPEPFTEDPPFGEMPIPPGAAHSEISGVTMPFEEVKDLGNGLNCLMAYGIIRYRDNAKEPHFTRFCFIWRRVIPSDDPERDIWHYTPVGPPAYIEYT